MTTAAKRPMNDDKWIEKLDELDRRIHIPALSKSEANDLSKFLADWGAWRDSHFIDAEGKPLAQPMAIAGHLLREAVELVFAVRRWENGGRPLSYGELMRTIEFVENQVAVSSDRAGVKVDGFESGRASPDPGTEAKRVRELAREAVRLEAADVALLTGTLSQLLKFDLLEAMADKAAIVKGRKHGPVQANGIVEHLRESADREFDAIQAKLDEGSK